MPFLTAAATAGGLLFAPLAAQNALAAIAALPAWLAQSPDIARLSAELTPLATTAP